METIYTSDLEPLKEIEKVRQTKALEKIKDYKFYENIDLLRKLTNNPTLFKSETTLYVDKTDTIYVQFLSKINHEFFNHYVSPYNVMLAKVNGVFISSREANRDEDLTAALRQLMNDNYSDTTYIKDAEAVLEEERNARKQEIDADVNSQIENLRALNIETAATIS